LKAQAFDLMVFLAESNGCRVQIQGGVALGLKVAHDIGGTTAMAATHFQNILT
jgi:hypothetical protein